MHVLVCEDDELIASGIVAGLTAQGLTVEHVNTASKARALAGKDPLKSQENTSSSSF